MIEFVGFPKIARLTREIIITEKIDGTNGCIYISEDKTFLVGSRSQWITPEKDNYGFAGWAYKNKDELIALGGGTHFGEWWGSGIQRGYGLEKGEKRFSLFNTRRWCLSSDEPKLISIDPKTKIEKWQEKLPKVCSLVPELYRGIFDTQKIDMVLENLRVNGSSASKGFMTPEGIVIYHIAGNICFKKTIEKDEEYKGKNG